MYTVTINDNTYDIPEMTFDTVCALEENGVELLNLSEKSPRIATTTRGLVAWVMGVSPAAASREIVAHLKNGGNLADILVPITNAIGESGFFARDNKGKVTNMPQNRQQRRHQNGQRANSQRRENTDHSQN